jgi:hypothetical protein
MTHNYYVGLDVHKETISISHALEGSREEATYHGQCSGSIAAVTKALQKLAEKLNVEFIHLKVCYEASPTGFVIARHLLRNCLKNSRLAGIDLRAVRENELRMWVHCWIFKHFMDCVIHLSFAGPLRRPVPAIFKTASQKGVDCVLMSPSKTERKPGDKIKTDKSDACNIASPLSQRRHHPTSKSTQPYQRGRTSITGLRLELRKIM